ncbi:unnamed protein product [Mytilus coruscus]|uniref:Peptidase A2 domain-containing protein n=1 Tax=Mytilus coruscus TaxID=42192 RepID=A0A6J7ZW87_MYTCO|nr:unnamed protein product [Mytilus coruscus]
MREGMKRLNKRKDTRLPIAEEILNNNINALQSLLRDEFLEDNELVGLTEFNLCEVNSPDNTGNLNPEINVLLDGASQIESTPQPLSVTTILTETNGHIAQSCTKQERYEQVDGTNLWGGAQSSGLTTSISADFDENATKDNFWYITVLFGELRISALVDTGSSINVLSKSLYDFVSDRHKLYFEESDIRLANNDKIHINGISKLQATIHQKNEIIEKYVIPKTSHPLILCTEYLRENKIVLHFSDFSCNQKTVPVKTAKRIELEPNTEYFTFGKLPNHVTVGLQGICVNSKFSVNHKFLVAKSIVVFPVNRKVPIKLLNASNIKITIPKGKNIAEFSTLLNEYTYVAMLEKSEIPEVQTL